MNFVIHGMITGMLFGFLLQRGGIFRYEKQLGVLLFKDMTVIKFMLSAVLVAMTLIHLLYGAGLVNLQIKPTILGANIVGGLLFGLGWALLGYCPATQMGALGEGRMDSIAGIAGMLAGGILYAESYPLLKKTLLSWGVLGKITLPETFLVSPWLIIAILLFLGLGAFQVIEQNKK